MGFQMGQMEMWTQWAGQHKFHFLIKQQQLSHDVVKEKKKSITPSKGQG